MDTFRTMIVSASVAEQCRALAASFEGGVGMWTVPLFTGPDETHYISTGQAPAWVIDLLPYTDHSGDELVIHEGNLELLVEQINERSETPVTIEQMQALLSMADVSTQPWPDALVRLGLTTAPQEIE